MASVWASIQEGEANAAAPCKEDSSENGRMAGYNTKSRPESKRGSATAKRVGRPYPGHVPIDQFLAGTCGCL